MLEMELERKKDLFAPKEVLSKQSAGRIGREREKVMMYFKYKVMKEKKERDKERVRKKEREIERV